MTLHAISTGESRVTTVQAVVVTALRVEFAAFRSHLTDITEIIHPKGTVYDVGTLDAEGHIWRVALVEVGAGNDTAAVEAERAIEYFNPTHALFVGVAGGIKDVALGDVVAASKVYGYEAGKDAGQFLVRPDVGEPSHDMLQRARAVARQARWNGALPVHAVGTVPCAYVGPIAAGAKVVVSHASETATFLRNHYGDALAVEMEGRGFLRATHASPSLRALVVRGISDLLDGKSDADAHGWQEVAAANAAAFSIAVLAGLVPLNTDARQTAANAGSARMSLNQNKMDGRTELTKIAAALYPEGPLQRHVWQRAGGDVATLDLQGTAHSTWYGAIDLVLLGGGGTTIKRLTECMRQDFPENDDLRRLAQFA